MLINIWYKIGDFFNSSDEDIKPMLDEITNDIVKNITTVGNHYHVIMVVLQGGDVKKDDKTNE